MRCLMKVSMPVEKANAAIKDGSLGRNFESVMADLKPEAAYFYAEDGKRTAIIIFDLKDPSQIPAVAEPFFLSMNAGVDMHPVMSAEDLRKGMSGLPQIIKKYG